MPYDARADVPDLERSLSHSEDDGQAKCRRCSDRAASQLAVSSSSISRTGDPRPQGVRSRVSRETPYRVDFPKLECSRCDTSSGKAWLIRAARTRSGLAVAREKLDPIFFSSTFSRPTHGDQSKLPGSIARDKTADRFVVSIEQPFPDEMAAVSDARLDGLSTLRSSLARSVFLARLAPAVWPKPTSYYD